MTWFDFLLLTVFTVGLGLGMRQRAAGVAWIAVIFVGFLVISSLPLPPLLYVIMAIVVGFLALFAGDVLDQQLRPSQSRRIGWRMSGFFAGALLGVIMAMAVFVALPPNPEVDAMGVYLDYPSRRLPSPVYEAVNGSLVNRNMGHFLLRSLP